MGVELKKTNDIGWHLVKFEGVGADSVHKKISIFGEKIRRIYSGVLLGGGGGGGFVLETPHHPALKMNLVAPNRGGRFKAIE